MINYYFCSQEEVKISKEIYWLINIFSFELYGSLVILFTNSFHRKYGEKKEQKQIKLWYREKETWIAINLSSVLKIWGTKITIFHPQE